MIRQLVFLALAGAAGTLLRTALGELVQRGLGSAYPWGTLFVNVIGCFFAGACVILADHRFQLAAETRLIVFAGFFGAFTTFSALIVDTGRFIDQSDWLRAASVLLLHNGVGILALLGGAAAGRKLIKGFNTFHPAICVPFSF